VAGRSRGGDGEQGQACAHFHRPHDTDTRPILGEKAGSIGAVSSADQRVATLDESPGGVPECRATVMAGPADSAKSDKRKQSLYFPETMLDEIQKEAQRLQRSMSWVVQRAWKHARREIKGIPGSNEP
jgi:uncharacterized small protein (TIGR04563 family)